MMFLAEAMCSITLFGTEYIPLAFIISSTMITIPLVYSRHIYHLDIIDMNLLSFLRASLILGVGWGILWFDFAFAAKVGKACLACSVCELFWFWHCSLPVGLSDAKRTSLVVFATPESGAFDAQSAKGLFWKGVGVPGGEGNLLEAPFSAFFGKTKIYCLF